MATIVLAYLFYCIIECPIVNLLNLFQGKIFYDVKNYKPRPSTSGDGLRGQADMNGNGHVRKDSSGHSEMDNNSDMLSYPPNIVVQDYDSVSEGRQQQPNEFEMSPQGHSSTANDGVATVEAAVETSYSYGDADCSGGGEMATSHL